MTEFALGSTVLLPVGLGLLGFIEPCSLGTTLLVVKQLEGSSAGRKLTQVGVFAAMRSVLVGLLGMLAVLLGAPFLGLQRGAWIGLGAVYMTLGLLYLSGHIKPLMVSLGPSLNRLKTTRGSAALGVLFGLNIPACAAPLLVALLGSAAAGGAAGATLTTGFVSLGLFGFALSLPLVLAVFFAPTRRAIDWLAGLSGRLPIGTGLLLIAVGLWSIGFALSAASSVVLPK